MPMIGIQELLMVLLVGLVLILPCWRIFTKAGFPGPLALTLLVPVLNIVVLFYVAFTDWPTQRQPPPANRNSV